jgi:flagellar hook-length control protein FliK
MQDILPREDAMKPEKAPTRVPRVAELQCEEQPAADGAVQAPRPGSTPVRSPIAAPPVEQHPDDGPRAAAQVPVPAHDPVRVLVTRESPSGTPPADIPRLMAEVMAVKGASSGRIFSLESPGKRDAQLAASTTTEPPVNPAPTPTADLQGWEGNDRQSGQLPHREKAIATGGRTGDSSAGENPPTAEIRAAATKDLPATEKEPELSGAVRTGPAAPVVREVPEHRSRSLNTHEAATAAAVQRSQPESETNERTPAEGHVREPLRNIFPILQQNRVGDFVRGKAAERGVGVQGLPRELVRSVLDRVVRELVITGAKGGTEARLALKPDSLGELLVHISMDDNVMTAKIEVTQPAAKAVLDAGMPQLREALTARGISVQQIDVFTSTDSMPRQGREQREGRPRSGGMRRPEAVVAEAVALPRMLGYNTIELSM